MATVNFIQKGKTQTIYCRFRHKNVDLVTSTQIYIKQKFWDTRNQKIKNVISVPERDKINLKLSQLSIHIISRFNIDFSNGEFIDRIWLDKTINDFYKRPDSESKEMIYLSDFACWWIKTKGPKYKMKSGKLMPENILNMYQVAADILEQYEVFRKTKVKIANTDRDFFDDLIDFILHDLDYAESTTKRIIKRFKFFCARAEEDNIRINKGYKSKYFISKDEAEYKEPYLSENQIEQVFYFSTDDKKLELTKDNWIIGLWTGLRVSDFLTRLNINNINGDFIEIKTKKTKSYVTVPLHWQVKEILRKYNGLPPKMGIQEFNENIREISKKLGFTNIMTGGVVRVNKITGRKRKIIGEYEKWELVSSHICRRSFCTNLLGKVPNNVIMDVAGWKSEQQMFDYNQQTNKESAIKLKKYWDEKDKSRLQKNHS